MRTLNNYTEKLQHRLAEYCRTGSPNFLPGTNGKGMKHYRRLSFNIFNNTLEQAYPITYEYLDESEWTELVDGFFSGHDCQTPLLWQMPYEFYTYVEENDLKQKEKYPFLPELLYFEWLEIEVHTMEDIDIQAEYIPDKHFEDTIPLVNPEHRLVQLNYPLHLKPIKEAIQHPGQYFVLIFRDPDEGNVHFINLSVVFVFALEQLSQQDLTINELTEMISEQFGVEDTGEIKKHLEGFFEHLFDQQAVLGYKPKKQE